MLSENPGTAAWCPAAFPTPASQGNKPGYEEEGESDDATKPEKTAAPAAARDAVGCLEEKRKEELPGPHSVRTQRSGDFPRMRQGGSDSASRTDRGRPQM